MKVGLLICSYNRPKYLRQCLESVKRADLPDNTIILIVDDNSDNQETKELLSQFRPYQAILVVLYRKDARRGIADSIKIGSEYLFSNGAEVVINIDSDAVVRNDFISVLLRLHKGWPDRIITGFNCKTKNKDGSERHRILEQGVGFNMKRTVGGINMLFSKETRDKYLAPALQKSISEGGNWDYFATKSAYENGFPTICAEPSVVQHIGFESSMGHSSGGEPPDVADDFKPIHLDTVTLIGVDCVNVDRLIRAADISCKGVEFAEVTLLSSIPSDDPRVVSIKHLPTKTAYSEFMVKELANYIFTKHILVIQYDGFVLNPYAWRREWLQYDYIGAPWMWYDDGKNVGNGGFSFRTRRLHDILAGDNNIIPINEPGVTTNKEEDHCIARLYRSYLENTHGVKFAPIQEALKFSIEGWRSKNKTWNGEFGFHGHTADITKSGYTI